jgi:hypothetical protein
MTRLFGACRGREGPEVPDLGAGTFEIVGFQISDEVGGRFSLPPFALLCGHSRNKTIASADWRDFQVQGGILWVTAFIHDFEVSLMVLPNADQYIGLLVMFTEVSTKTALSILNWLHLLPSFDTEHGERCTSPFRTR